MLIVAGKGGVGKTTVTAALARMAADAGLTALIVEVEGKSGLAAAFGHDDTVLDYNEIELSPGVRARTLTPDRALVEYLQDHGLKRLSKRLSSSGVLDVVATAAPGIKDILVLGKVKQLERAGAADVIIVDAPAAGHAVTFLASARGLIDAVRVGPILTQAEEVVALLNDAARCQVILVTLPEETPVNEVVETAFALEDRVGVQLGPVVVNGLYPVRDLDLDATSGATSPAEEETLRAAGEFRLHRQGLQREQLERLATALPLPRLELPLLFTTELGAEEVGLLAAALAEQVQALPEPETVST
ncbi:MAG TPA: ArsA-related P-loop ATPase [Acidimicrobiales bacterium]|nr:ArsA-related P-loop ATPase [Acidimicrobiales bacterium]